MRREPGQCADLAREACRIGRPPLGQAREQHDPDRVQRHGKHQHELQRGGEERHLGERCHVRGEHRDDREQRDLRDLAGHAAGAVVRAASGPLPRGGASRLGTRSQAAWRSRPATGHRGRRPSARAGPLRRARAPRGAGSPAEGPRRAPGGSWRPRGAAGRGSSRRPRGTRPWRAGARPSRPRGRSWPCRRRTRPRWRPGRGWRARCRRRPPIHR